MAATALVALLHRGVAVAAAPPANDTCATPTAIGALPFNGSGTTVRATDDVQTLAAGCSAFTQVAGPDVIYTLDLGTGNGLTFSVTPAAGYDTAIYLLGTCGDGLTCQQGADAGSVGVTETFNVSGLAPGTYAFYVDSYYATGNAINPSAQQGTYTLAVTGSLASSVTTTTTTTIAGSSTLSVTTSTSFSPTTTTLGAPVCVNGAPVSGAVVRVTRVGSPLGDEGMLVRGVLDLPAGVPAGFDPGTRGAQLLVEDLGGGGTAVVDLSAASAPIPPGARGTACGSRDGWDAGVYRNRSNALLPPACPPGSAHGLRLLRFKDRRATGRGIAFKAVLAGTTAAAPVGPLRVTLVLGATPATGLAGECGTLTFAPAACALKRHIYRCG